MGEERCLNVLPVKYPAFVFYLPENEVVSATALEFVNRRGSLKATAISLRLRTSELANGASQNVKGSRTFIWLHLQPTNVLGFDL